MTETIRVEHLARVEGHGGVTIELDGGEVSAVRFDVFEGARLLEGLVRGRGYQDVSQILSRICAICSTAHALTSLKATEDAFGVELTPQTQILRDLLYLGENIESHALHVFLLALPDYLGYPAATAMAADYPDAVKIALRLKKLGNVIQEIIGGRAVHPVNAVLGGFGRLPAADQLITLRRMLVEGIADCRAAFEVLAALPPADFCHSGTVYASLRPSVTGSYYHGAAVEISARGVRTTIPAAAYRTLTNEKAVPHSHAKHSTYEGRPFMVGALARLTNRESLDADIAANMAKLSLVLPSDNPMDNNKAQAVELAADLAFALRLVDQLLEDGIREEAPVPITPRAATGVGITEAPRGTLIHSYTYDREGRVEAADVITPTALNAASVEDHLRRTVEQSADRDVPAVKRKAEMIVRAYDPCISCSVHAIQLRDAF